ncbi:ABC transporter permease [Labrys wisconsinensis]|uniref:Ribose transport system permease protein n=1 Tax=Labrys wisconsinensis TaxID=425677 RepID=A0ABU0JAW9_9HYPH|nr:ABC transporter permease [Labrys wisconsinensis]MDQ0471411.1 ribose transport system permease protein [Labrys wisconsinensis]
MSKAAEGTGTGIGGWSLGRLLAQQGILVAFVAAMLVFGLLSDRFLAFDNIMAVLRQIGIVGVMAIGVTMVVIGGNLDLSVGSMLSMATVLVVDLHDRIGPSAAILVMFGAVLTAGAVNGILVGYLRLNSLIVTLGMLSTLQGITLIYTDGKNVDIADQSATWFAIFGRGDVLGVPTSILMFFGIAALGHILLTHLPFGRQVYATGGNPRTAVYSGIRRGRVVFFTYLISSFTVGCSALILGSRVMGSQNNVGQGYELLVLSAVILGGTSLLGGSGNMLKTVIGVLILGFIQNGLLLLGFPYYAQWLVTSVVIILTVWLDVASKRGRLWSHIA